MIAAISLAAARLEHWLDCSDKRRICRNAENRATQNDRRKLPGLSVFYPVRRAQFGVSQGLQCVAEIPDDAFRLPEWPPCRKDLHFSMRSLRLNKRGEAHPVWPVF